MLDKKLTFEELYEEYSKDVYRFSYWLSGNRMMAEDMTSETFVRAWVRFGKIHTETLKGYLLAIAKNIYYDELRKHKRLTDLPEEQKKNYSEPQEEFEVKEQLEGVQRVLMRFSDIDRTAFILKVEQELSYEEVSRVLEISVASAKVKVHRIRKKLLEDRIKREG